MNNTGSFTAAEVQTWKASGVPKEWDPLCNVKLSMGPGGKDGETSPIMTPLDVPESVVLGVFPRGCTRHGDVHRVINPGLAHRIWYLRIEEKDIVTGNYLAETEQAIEECVRLTHPTPKVLFIVTTCIDLLLGSDYASLARKMEKKLGIRIGVTRMQPIMNGKMDQADAVTYGAMYQTLRKQSEETLNEVNIIGRPSGPAPDSEFVRLLKEAGIDRVNHITDFDTLEEADRMCQAKLNIAIEYDAVSTARMLEKTWGTPYVYIRNSFLPDEIHANYRKLSGFLGITIKDDVCRAKIQAKLQEVLPLCQEDRIVTGENTDNRALRGAAELAELGFPVKGVFHKIVLQEDYEYVERLEAIDPEIKIYLSGNPLHFWNKLSAKEYNLAIGLMNTYFDPANPPAEIPVSPRYPEYQALGTLLDQIRKLKCPETTGDANTSNAGAAFAAPAAEPYKQLRNWRSFR